METSQTSELRRGSRNNDFGWWWFLSGFAAGALPDSQIPDFVGKRFPPTWQVIFPQKGRSGEADKPWVFFCARAERV